MYGFNDAKQAAVGAAIASLIIIVLRQDPIEIDPGTGLIIGLEIGRAHV